MIPKMEPVEQRANLKGIAKKICCPEHQLKYSYKCQYPTCESPFICYHINCIENHLHQSKITMSKFESENLAMKFYEVQSMISDDTMNQNARRLKTYIEELKDSIKNIYVGIKIINQNYDYLKGDLEGSLTMDYINKVEQNHHYNQEVRKNLDLLKNKVKLQFPMKDSYFALRSYLVEFLFDNIPGFSWSKSLELYNSKNQLTTCEKFHEKLYGKKDLLFIFIGETRILGSYFACEYPTLAEKSKKDLQSFLFINDEKDSPRFIKYSASNATDQHLLVSEKNYICHGNTPSYGDGIRTFHRNFETLNYCLPSNTFVTDLPDQLPFSGTLRVKKFMILQVHQDRQKPANGQEDDLD